MSQVLCPVLGTPRHCRPLYADYAGIWASTSSPIWSPRGDDVGGFDGDAIPPYVLLEPAFAQRIRLNAWLAQLLLPAEIWDFYVALLYLSTYAYVWKKWRGKGVSNLFLILLLLQCSTRSRVGSRAAIVVLSSHFYQR